MPPYGNADSELEAKSESREAEITTGSDGEPLGACVYLTPTDLEALGIDLSTTGRFRYAVDDGQLSLEEVEDG